MQFLVNMEITLSNNLDDVEGLAEAVQTDRCRAMWTTPLLLTLPRLTNKN